MTPFFLKTEGFTKRSLFFIVPTKWPPIFLLSSLKDPLFSLLVCHRKTPTLGVLSAHPRHFHMWVTPSPGGRRRISLINTWDLWWQERKRCTHDVTLTSLTCVCPISASNHVKLTSYVGLLRLRSTFVSPMVSNIKRSTAVAVTLECL